MKNTRRNILIIVLLVLIACFGYKTLKAQALTAMIEKTTIEITQNPHGSNPLVAIADIDTSKDIKVKVTVLGKGEDGIAISNVFDINKDSQEVPVFGLYPEHNNTVVFEFLKKDTLLFEKTVEIQTEALASKFEISILENNLPKNDSDVFLIANVGFDQQGEIRWTFEKEVHHVYDRAKNGNFFIASAVDKKLYHAARFMEVSLTGEVVQTYEVPGYVHHEVFELPSGNLLVPTNTEPFEPNSGLPEEDVIVEMDRETGEIVKTWDLNEILDPTRLATPRKREWDWPHVNAVYFDESDTSMVLSAKNQNTVAKIDYETGEVIWLLADHAHWGEEFQQYLLTPVDENGDELDVSEIDFWTGGQHAPLKFSEDTIVVYDNGTHRQFYRDGIEDTEEMKKYTRIVKYKIDTKNKTVQLVSSYAHPDAFSSKKGDVDYLGGSYLIGFMNINGTPKSRVVEVSNDYEVLFEADIRWGDDISYRTEKFDL